MTLAGRNTLDAFPYSCCECFEILHVNPGVGSQRRALVPSLLPELPEIVEGETWDRRSSRTFIAEHPRHDMLVADSGERYVA